MIGRLIASILGGASLVAVGAAQAAPPSLHAAPSVPFRPLPLHRRGDLRGARFRRRVGLVPARETLLRFDAESGRLVARIAVAPKPAAAVVANEPEASVTVAAGFVWVADQASQRVIRVAPGSNRVVARVRVQDPHQLVIGGGSAWVTDFAPYEVARVDLASNRIVSSFPAAGPTGAAFGDGSLWVVAHRAERVLKVDPSTGAILATIQLDQGSRPESAWFDLGALWVSAAGSNALVRIDPATNSVAVTIPLPAGALGGFLASGGGSIWVSNFGAVFRGRPADQRDHGLVRRHPPGQVRRQRLPDRPPVQRRSPLRRLAVGARPRRRAAPAREAERLVTAL